MSRQRSRDYLKTLLVGTVTYVVGGFFSVGHADVTASGLNTTINVVGSNFNVTGGTRPKNGTNLFHSFGNFSLDAPESAVFLNDSGLATKNILSRVTGGNPSSIFGTIDSSAFGNANLFLMNPAGIVFGPTAQLNVGGSFHATTADYIKLGIDGIFYADPAQPTVLSVAPPSAFGFLTSNPVAIDVNTSNLLVGASGQTLSFVGGPVNVGTADGSAPGYVLSPAGRVNLVSVASPGEAAFDGTGFNVDSFSHLGNVDIAGGSIIDGKDIVIRGGRLTIDDALLAPGLFSLLGLPLPLPDGGEVNINVSGDVNIIGTPGGTPALFGFASGVFVFAGGDGATALSPGKVPDIKIEAQNLHMSGTAGLQNNRVGPGLPGDIVVTARTITLQNGANIATVNAYEGAAGNILVNAAQVTLAGDGTPNPAGFEGIAAQGVFNPLFGLSVDPALTNAGSGNITINASESLSVRGTAQITTDSLAFGPGSDITINVGDMHLASTGEAERAGILAQSALAGDAGNITINATGTIELSDGFRISASTGGSGNGGNVQVTAGRGIAMTGTNSRILSGTAQPPDDVLNAIFLPAFDISFDDLRTNILGNPSASLMEVLAFLNNLGLTAVADLTPGDGGAISITAPVLTMNADTRIEASTGWEGNAGAIVANVNSLLLKDGASVRNRSGLELLAGGFAIGTGNAGTVNIAATDTISLSGHSPTSGAGSAITTSTLGDGNAGNISLSANQVNVENGGSVSSASGETVNGQLLVGTGNAGQITVSSPTLTMTDGGTISVNTFGAGNAGNILLNVTNFRQTGGSRVDSSTSGAGQGGDLTVTAANSASISGTGTGLFSTASGSGAGGNVHIQAGQLVQLADNATLSAQSTGTATATAGNITINTPTFETQNASVTTGATLADGGNISIVTTGSMVHLTDSQITTSVQSGEGSGGNITMNSELIVLDDSQVLANAFGGPGGNITITGDVFLVNSGGQAPTSLAGIVQASSALSTPGTINIEATVTDVSGTVAQLPEAPLQATELLRAACAARFVGGKTSSLVLGGRDGLPLQPGSLLPSPPYLASNSSSPSTISSSTGFSLPTGFSLLGSSDRNLNRYSLLPNFKCSL